jgi:hypothetical protein
MGESYRTSSGITGERRSGEHEAESPEARRRSGWRLHLLAALVALAWLIPGPPEAGGAPPPPGGKAKARAAGRRGSVVAIDRKFLAARKAGPIVLDRQGTRYVLQTDVRTAGTAVVVAAANVTLDLNGHQLIYGNHGPCEVPNSGFEQGEGRNVPHWDLRGASGASSAENTRYLRGKRVLRVSCASGPQRIVSGPITIPRSSHTFAAAITPVGNDHRTTLKLSVLDAATSRVLGQGASRNVQRGFSAIAHFVPKAAGAIRLQVDIDPGDGREEVVDLDDAAVYPSYDYGIVATRRWDGEIAGWSNLPPHATRGYRTAANFAVVGGKVAKGGGEGYGSSPLYCADLPGLTVEGVETFAAGMDTRTLVAERAGAVSIRDCRFVEEIGAISNRMENYATLGLEHVSGALLVEKNRLIGSPQIGISLGFNEPGGAVKVVGNEIRPKAATSNAYGIVAVSLRDFEIRGNRILAENGRGIDIDGYAAAPTVNGQVRDNYVEVQERLNREYRTRSESRALRLRNNIDAMGPHRDLLITGNTFIAKTGPGLAQKAFGARISYVNRERRMDRAGIVLQGNTFRAVALTEDPEYRASALVIDTLEPGIRPTITGNILESNDSSLTIGESEGGDNAEVSLVANTFKKATGVPDRPYTAIRAGYYEERIDRVAVIDPRFDGGAALNILWAGTGTKRLGLGWLLEIAAKDGTGHPVSGAAIRVTDGTGREGVVGPTDSQGRVSIPVTCVVHRQEGQDSKAITVRDLNPFTVHVKSGSSAATRTLRITASQALDITLGKE